MEKALQVILYAFVGALVITAILIGLRTSALKSAYDSASDFNVTDSAGTVHTVTGSGISGDTIATVYSLLTGLVWLAFVVVAIFEVVAMFKHKA